MVPQGPKRRESTNEDRSRDGERRGEGEIDLSSLRRWKHLESNFFSSVGPFFRLRSRGSSSLEISEEVVAASGGWTEASGRERAHLAVFGDSGHHLTSFPFPFFFRRIIPPRSFSSIYNPLFNQKDHHVSRSSSFFSRTLSTKQRTFERRAPFQGRRRQSSGMVGQFWLSLFFFVLVLESFERAQADFVYLYSL